LPENRFILASASPRRRSLLRDAGYEFEIDPADIDETPPRGLLPSKVAVYLAEEKAKAIATLHPEAVILAADTVVAFGDTLLGKPKDPADAKKMLQLLAGTTHLVITGVCVMRQSPEFVQSTRVMSAVKMRQLTPGEIDRYVQSNEWEGKAGGYGIQDRDPFVVRQSGSHTNIVGLPMSATRQLLEEAGIKPTQNT
jgi:nucleoside triphosphate pyrophosphatase